MSVLRSKGRFSRRALGLGVCFGAFFASSAASAQSTTFYLDRLQIGGAPEDGVGIWRPQLGEQTRLFGQVGLGYSLSPYRVENYIDTIDQSAIVREQNGDPVTGQLITYITAGAEILERFSIQVCFPMAVYQSGNAMSNTEAKIDVPVDLQSFAPMDLRIDGRVVFYRNEAKTIKLGAIAQLWAPTGDELGFGGDVSTHGALGVAGEYDAGLFAAVLNAGYHFRPPKQLNEFKLADELTFGAGVYMPLLDKRLRLGVEFNGSIGIGNDTTGDVDNTPLEWRAEGRYSLIGDASRGSTLWVGLAGGTRVSAGYVPDFRGVFTIGGAITLSDTKPKNVAFQYVFPPDADNDGLPNDIDLCPDKGEDGKGANTDDGCPEMANDSDSDGIPDAEDACVHEPGVKNDDPKKNGCPEFIRRNADLIEVLQEVEFAFDRADLRESAFPILNEVVRLLNVNPGIELVRIEGHTDDQGTFEYNDKLSQDRANSVMKYLVQRGIAANRLEAKGFGKRKPIADNSTKEGRQKNRRVEFHLVQVKGEAPVKSTGDGKDPAPAPTPAPAPAPSPK